MPTPMTPSSPLPKTSYNAFKSGEVCLICRQEGGSMPGPWHVSTCVMHKVAGAKHEAEVFWDDLERSLKAQLNGNYR